MKKAFLFLLTALIVLPLFATVSVEAAEAGEGPFIPVYTGSQLETIVADGKTKDGLTVPIAGYYYDFAGFHLKSPTYSKSSTPLSQISTRNSFDLTKNNDPAGHVLSVEFTVDAFGYDGGIKKDEWICLSITDKQNVVPGGATYQDGMFILLRGTGDGLVWIQPHLDSGKTFKECSKAYAKDVPVPKDANGREVYTFVVDYVGGEWKIYVNNTDVTPDMVTLTSGATMASIFSSFSDAAYFGITTQTGYVDELVPENNVIELSIQQYNSAVPAGTDSAEPKNSDVTFAPLADSATVPANQPAILWDSKKTSFNDYYGMAFTFSENADGSVHLVTDQESEGPYLVWNVKPEISYKAEDFPIICIASRDLISLSGYAYYCAGDVLAPEDQWRMNTYYNEYELGDGWFLSFIDLSYLWDGRINALRIGFSMKNFEPEFKEFDIGFMGAFRSEEEGIAFAYDYLKPMGLTQTAPQTEATSAPTPVTTAAPAETSTVPADTSAVPSDVTTVAATEAPADTTAASDSGCGSLIAVGAFLPLLLGAAYVLHKKD